MSNFFTDGAAAGPGRSVHWNTPPEILDAVRQLGPIELDPCSNAGSMVNASASIAGDDGTVINWTVSPGGVVFINPPYGRGAISPFAAKFASEARKKRSSHLIALVPARVETRWFAQFVAPDGVVWLAIRGRLKFWINGEPGQSAPFPSALIYAGPDPDVFAEIFGDLGTVWSRKR